MAERMAAGWTVELAFGMSLFDIEYYNKLLHHYLITIICSVISVV